MTKPFTVKNQSKKSTTRWSVPDHIAKPMSDLALALGCKGMDIVEQLVRHQPGTELTLVGHGGFVISLNIPLYALTESDMDGIMLARLGDEDAADSAREINDSDDAVTIEEASKAKAAVAAQNPETKAQYAQVSKERTSGPAQDFQQSEENATDVFLNRRMQKRAEEGQTEIDGDE